MWILSKRADGSPRMMQEAHCHSESPPSSPATGLNPKMALVLRAGSEVPVHAFGCRTGVIERSAKRANFDSQDQPGAIAGLSAAFSALRCAFCSNS